jgi:CHAD domain-containing protein/HD superfamily phosphodiesterase
MAQHILLRTWKGVSSPLPCSSYFVEQADMASRTQIVSTHKPQTAGLAHFMARALKERARAAKKLDAGAVHDLRVALRRCRTMADALATFDPDKSFPAMRKASKRTFRSLGKLRDTHVMREWVKKLAPAGDQLAACLLESLAQSEGAAKAEAATALEAFDTRKWRRWSRELAERSRRVPPESLVYQHLALARCLEVREAHRFTTRSRSRVSWHRLRIALKRFRYTVENFLPRHHEEWIADLKLLQDLLGDVHDLDVLRAEFRRILRPVESGADESSGAAPNEAEQWYARIDALRKERLSAYRAKMSGSNPIWNVWLAGLPHGPRLEEAVLATLSTWAAYRDPNFDHSRKVTALALELFDGFGAHSLNPIFRDAESRTILQAAALLHDVGRAKKDAGHHKRSFRMISELAPPVGWSEDEIFAAALIARYHRGAEPRLEQKEYAALEPAEQGRVAWLAATLRLADGLDSDHRGRIQNVSVQRDRTALTIRAVGYVHDVDSAAMLARKKHLLETLCDCPVVIQPAETRLAARVASMAS